MTGWNPQHVVVGVDGSEQSGRAAATAAAIARNHGAKLHMLTVVRPPEGWWGVVGSPPPADALAASMEHAQRTALDSTLERIDTAGLEVIASEEIGDHAVDRRRVYRRGDGHRSELLDRPQRHQRLHHRLLVHR